MPAGAVAFRFENRGTKSHEVAVALVRPGTGGAQIIAAARAKVPAPKLADAYADGPPLGVLFAAPGTRGRATLHTTLERGRTYLLVCTLRETPASAQHAEMGMFRIVHVR